MVVVKETAYPRVLSQQLFRLADVGNGVKHHVILLGQSWVVGVVVCADGKEREVIHEALEKIAHTSWFSLLSDIGDVFRSYTTLVIAVAHLKPSCHVREADGEIGLVGIHKPKFLAFSFGKFYVYSSLLQIGDERMG